MTNRTLLDENFFHTIQLLALQKDSFARMPYSFDEIHPDILKEIIEIDELYQVNMISRDEALDLMVELLVSYENHSRYMNDVRRHLRVISCAIYKLIEELKKGKITKEEFLEKYQKLHSTRLRLFRELYELELDDNSLSR